MKRPNTKDYIPMYSNIDDYVEDLEKYCTHLEELKLLNIPTVIDTLQNCVTCCRGVFVDRKCNNCGADKLTE